MKGRVVGLIYSSDGRSEIIPRMGSRSFEIRNVVILKQFLQDLYTSRLQSKKGGAKSGIDGSNWWFRKRRSCASRLARTTSASTWVSTGSPTSWTGPWPVRQLPSQILCLNFILPEAFLVDCTCRSWIFHNGFDLFFVIIIIRQFLYLIPIRNKT